MILNKVEGNVLITSLANGAKNNVTTKTTEMFSITSWYLCVSLAVLLT